MGILWIWNAETLASETGQEIADQVSAESYGSYMTEVLFAHLGDDRGVGGADHDTARDNIASTFESFGLMVDIEEFTFDSVTGYNVVATLPGATEPDAQYILGAHYDSLQTPGASDDATGVAALLEAARVLSAYQTELTIKFIAFDMEEWGLIGSGAYVDAHAGDDIRGMVQLEMIAYDIGDYASLVFGRGASMPIKQAVADAITEYGQELAVTVGGRLDASDHFSFESAGYDACVLTASALFDDPYYHTPQDSVDTPSYLDFQYASDFVRSLAGMLADLAVVITPVCEGDANSDGAVDPLDAGFVMSRFGCLVGSGDPECDGADVNGDLWVDPLDTGFVMARFGACP